LIELSWTDKIRLEAVLTHCDSAGCEGTST
jgi:hypothetical protein